MKKQRFTSAFALTLFLHSATILLGQGPWRNDEGHGCVNNHTVLSNWNFQAGKNMPKRYDKYQEFLPYLGGWDFRINLPHTRFQEASRGRASVPVLVGVVEGRPDDITVACKPCFANNTMAIYGHTNNSIWAFRVVESDGKLYYKVLPSRRDLGSSATENVLSLTEGWVAIPNPAGTRFFMEQPAIIVRGEGLGNATIFIAARAKTDEIYFTQLKVNSTSTPSWSATWAPLGVHAYKPVALSAGFNNQLLLAWAGPRQELKTGLLDPASSQVRVIVTIGTTAVPPQWLYDGDTVHLFAVANHRLVHTFTTISNPLLFSAFIPVSSLQLGDFCGFRVMSFNHRLHIAFNLGVGSSMANKTYYATTMTAPGSIPLWSAPTDIGIPTIGNPGITTLFENIYITGVNVHGRVAYARKNPNAPGVEITGIAGTDQWLEQGTEVDRTTPGVFENINVLSFNSDIYMAAQKNFHGNAPAGTYLVNFSRAAMKHLLQYKWGVHLTYGEPNGGVAVKPPGTFANHAETPMLGDVDGDGDDDFIKFNQAPEAGVGLAPVYVSLSKYNGFNDYGTHDPSNQRWQTSFAPAGEIPMTGDFNGDGKADIISFSQRQQTDPEGHIIGPAVVRVAVSDGTQFGEARVWHRFFSLPGEIPMVGDFNGDGKDDIATFTQSKQRDASGQVIGPAVVWVALSDGAKFGISQVWHTYFSLKGEIPMVGDFNGDGKTDIVSFVQQPQRNANGTLLGHAPVWVSLSDGRKFGTSRVWHTYFSPRQELPRIADVNMDGRDDIVTFIRGNTTGEHRDDVYTAYSTGDHFERSITWVSEFTNNQQRPFIGHLTSEQLSAITDNPRDRGFLPDIVAFNDNGAVNVSYSTRNMPYPAGAPWENYKWFTDKGVGVAQFPEWIYAYQQHCISPNHVFALLGAGGTGAGALTNVSVRAGSRAGHILQEFGHSIFANCFRENQDPFGFYQAMYNQSPETGGVGANLIYFACLGEMNHSTDPCSSTLVYDCRDPEHVFLGLLNKYRLNGDAYRELIRTETNPIYKTQLTASYKWLKEHWFNGLEFKRGVEINASLGQDGVPCLRGECQLASTQ